MKLTTGIIRAIFLFPIVELYVQTVTCLRLVEIVDDLLVLCHDINDKKICIMCTYRDINNNKGK